MDPERQKRDSSAAVPQTENKAAQHSRQRPQRQAQTSASVGKPASAPVPEDQPGTAANAPSGHANAPRSTADAAVAATHEKPLAAPAAAIPAHEKAFYDRLKEFLRGRGYELRDKIGGGGMGQVFKVYRTALKRMEALKLLQMNDRQLTDNDIARFEREAQALARLANDHRELPIPQVFDYFQSEGYFGYIMQLVDGEPLDKLIRQRSLPVDRAVRIAGDLARSLHILHKQNIVHRDIKPSNIIIRDDVPWLIDFGLAKDMDKEVAALTEPGRTLGTVMYMAPEQVEGKANPQSDIYALGAVFYEMIGFQPTVFGQSYTEVFYKILHQPPEPPSRCRARVMGEKLDPLLDYICLKALAKDQRKRYAEAGDMAADLDNYLTGIRSPLHPYRLRKALPAIKAAAPLVLVLVALLLGSQLLQKIKKKAPAEQTPAVGPIDKPVVPDKPIDKPVVPDKPIDKPVVPDKPIDKPVLPDKPIDKPAPVVKTDRLAAAQKAYQHLVQKLENSDFNQVLPLCSKAFVKEDLGMAGAISDRRQILLRIMAKSLATFLGEVDSVKEGSHANEVEVCISGKKQNLSFNRSVYMVYEDDGWKYDGNEMQRMVRSRNIKLVQEPTAQQKEAEKVAMLAFQAVRDHNREAFDSVCSSELPEFRKEFIFLHSLPLLRRHRASRAAICATTSPSVLVIVYKLAGANDELKAVIALENGKWKLRDISRKEP